MIQRVLKKLLSNPIPVIAVSLITIVLVFVVTIRALFVPDTRLANQQSLVGTWRCGAVVREGEATDTDPFNLIALRSVSIASDDLSVAEVAITLTWEDGTTSRGIGCTDMLPGFVRLNVPVAGRQLTVLTSSDGVVSIDDGSRAFVLERQ